MLLDIKILFLTVYVGTYSDLNNIYHDFMSIIVYSYVPTHFFIKVFKRISYWIMYIVFTIIMVYNTNIVNCNVQLSIKD